MSEVRENHRLKSVRALSGLPEAGVREVREELDADQDRKQNLLAVLPYGSARNEGVAPEAGPGSGSLMFGKREHEFESPITGYDSARQDRERAQHLYKINQTLQAKIHVLEAQNEELILQVRQFKERLFQATRIRRVTQ